MLDKIKEINSEIEQFKIDSKEQLENFRLAFISKKGKVSALFENFKNVAAEEKKLVGQELNKLKTLAQERFDSLAETLQGNADSNLDASLDFSLPPVPNELGTRHPI